MNWDAIGAIGEVIGAIAVVGTLGYLAVQIRQNTRNVESSAHVACTTGMRELFEWACTDERLDRVLREGWFEGKITKESWVTFLLWHHSYFYHLETIWHMHRRVGLDQEILDVEMGRAARLLAMPAVSDYWEAGGKTQVSKSLAAELERAKSEEHHFAIVSWDEERGYHAARESDT